MSIQLSVTVCSQVGWVVYQNGVSLLQELRVWNNGDQDYANLTLKLRCSLDFIEEKIWRLDSLKAHSTIEISDLALQFDLEKLFSQTESVKCQINLQILAENEPLISQDYPLELLAKNEWGGVLMADLLPAFVMPNDPAVEKLVKTAGEVLRKHKRDDSLDGYQSGKKQKVWEMASAAWSAVATLKLNYAEPPASFERFGQKIRTPSAIVESRLATCLDSSLLFAAILEQMGLHALLVLVEGHAFVGVWLAKESVDSDGVRLECLFSDLLTEDVTQLRKLVELSEIVLFETTLVTKAKVPPFSQAMDESLRRLASPFHYVIDVHRARLQGIKPLSLTFAAEYAVTDDSLEPVSRFEFAPSFPDELPIQAVENLDRFAIWKRKLLNLSTLNRLLHFPTGAKGVRFVSQQLAVVENWLAKGNLLRLISQEQFLESLKVQAGIAAGATLGMPPEQIQHKLMEYADNVAIKGECIVWSDNKNLEKQLNELYLQAKRDLEEGGANTLFLALGFLKWRKKDQNSQDYLAPLILLPLVFDRKGTKIRGVRLRDDEIRFNLTLLEMLRQDFEINLPSLSDELPCDDNGLAIEQILHIVRLAVKDLNGFEVLNEAAIGIFSFAKFYMWQDLVQHQDKIFAHPLSAHLLRYQKEESQLDGTSAFLQPNELDGQITASELFTPLAADSSQLTAVVASASGQSFVLDGPPGTGKSQTIANIIAHNLALGRRVLFVSEKKAALEVVYRRLEEIGLGDFCIELHSNKTSKSDFLNQLERAWSAREDFDEKEWQQKSAKLQQLRTKLNDFVQALHHVHENGLSAYVAIGETIRNADENTPYLDWEAQVHNAESVAEWRQICSRLGLNYDVVRECARALEPIRQTEWSNQWQSRLLQSATSLKQAINDFAEPSGKLSALLKQTQAVNNLAESAKFAEFTKLLRQAYERDLHFLFSPTVTQTLNVAEQAVVLWQEITALCRTLSANYALSALAEMNLSQLAQDWQQASNKFWFFATIAKKKVAKEVMNLAKTDRLPNVEQDLFGLNEIQAKLTKLLSLNIRLQEIPHWLGLDTDVGKFAEEVAYAKALHQAVISLADNLETLASLRQNVENLVVGGNALLAENSQISQQLNDYLRAYRTLAENAEQYASLTKQSLDMLDFISLQAQLDAVLTHQTTLNGWCAWNRARIEAENAGLGVIIQAVENRQLNAMQSVALFDTAYARWFASQVIDQSPSLRQFVSFEQQHDIETFRKLEKELHRLSVRYIRSKCAQALPDKNMAVKQGSLATLKHELQKKSRHKAIRQLCLEIQDILPQFTPCMLMSPLSIAQYLPLSLPKFDLVVFDEASQITPWDAIGTIARGTQVIVVGDDKQMPPTNFFQRVGSAQEEMEDLESILDECLAAGIHRHRLNWHYRSRYESLITFSNHTYYDGSLLTFPSAQNEHKALSWQKVDGIYQQGKMINEQEADAVVAEVVKRLTDDEFVASKLSIGIIALNSQQQALIVSKLEQARKTYPTISGYFSDEQIEPLIVKNLETIQGDERDLILFSIGFGPTEVNATKMSMNFGPLNREGGKRRLNVAISRARQEMVVFSSFVPEMIDLNRTKAEAIKQLKHFLEFADKGTEVIPNLSHQATGLTADFEKSIADGLRQKGWNVQMQIGASRFRVDIGVLHPERENEYLAGILCDGLNYKQADTASDRENVRYQVLTGLGWQLISCWSLDWWIDKEKALNDLDKKLREKL